MTSLSLKLLQASESTRSLLCVGLDPDPTKMPLEDVFEFNRAIIDATKDFAACFKPNLPFYEALGIPGLTSLERTIDYIRSEAPSSLLLGDCKRGDIDSTNVFYARSLFEMWGFDAATVNVYAGMDSIQPFLDYREKGVFVFCRSSNQPRASVQDMQTVWQDRKMRVFEAIAEEAKCMNAHGNVGLVMGATHPEELKSVRRMCPGIPFLVPGVGAQGGDLERSVADGLDISSPNIIVNSSRGIIYASTDKKRFQQAAHDAAKELRDAMNRILVSEGRAWSSN